MIKLWYADVNLNIACMQPLAGLGMLSLYVLTTISMIIALCAGTGHGVHCLYSWNVGANGIEWLVQAYVMGRPTHYCLIRTKISAMFSSIFFLAN